MASFDFKGFSSGLSSMASAAGAFGAASVAGASAAAEDLLAKGSRIQGEANVIEADTYAKAAGLATENKALVEQNTGIQTAVNTIQAMQERRNTYRAMGATRADVGAAGLSMASGTDLLADSARQGEITQQLFQLQGGVITTQGRAEANSIETQIEAYRTQEKTSRLAAESSEIAAQAHEANAVGMRSSASASKTGGILSALGSVLGIGKAIFCWVAREVYGERNPRWLEFRYWMLNHAPAWFRNLYARHGEAFAGWLRKHPWAKPPVKWCMEAILLMAHMPAGEWAHA